MFSDLLFRLRSLFRRSIVENELDDELQFHLDKQVEKHVRAGLTREEGTRLARLQFGGVGRVKEECRESRGLTLLETAAQDVRYALRQLSRTPVFTTTVLLVVFRRSPASLDQPASFQPVKSRIKRALLNPQDVARSLLNTLGNGPAVLGTESECPENEEIQGSLRKVEVLGNHVSPSTSTGKIQSFL
jgi:hypothetical protein